MHCGSSRGEEREKGKQRMCEEVMPKTSQIWWKTWI